MEFLERYRLRSQRMGRQPTSKPASLKGPPTNTHWRRGDWMRLAPDFSTVRHVFRFKHCCTCPVSVLTSSQWPWSFRFESRPILPRATPKSETWTTRRLQIIQYRKLVSFTPLCPLFFSSSSLSTGSISPLRIGCLDGSPES